jgi:hypothetical protein
MKRLFGILSVLVCATTMIYAQASGIATLQSSDVVIPLNGAAAKGKVIDSGSCGKNVNYELYDDYTLRIYGNGAMDNFMTYRNVTVLQRDQAPWGIELYKKIKAVVIENGVTHIGGRSFYECASLTKVTIANSVKSIGYAAFNGCTALANITIPNSVTSFGEWAFAGCSGLTNINIPNSVTSIGYAAFDECSGLTSITIPNSVTSIGEWAFAYCSGLTNITFPNSVTSTGVSAFYGCSGLTSINFPNSAISIGELSFYGCSGLKNITIPNSVTSIGKGAFDDCAKLKYVKIAKNVTEIGYGAFPQTGDEDLVIEFTSETPATLYDVESFGFLCTIYVPETALETYLNAKYWKDHADQIMPKNYATGINSISCKQSEKEATIYDLQGNKVTEMQSKGIYIVNGKKIMK